MSARHTSRRRVMVVTGSRSEFGLLRPVMEAVRGHRKLELKVVVAGEHLLKPARTWREVESAFGIDASVPMQRQNDLSRADHAAACGRGIQGIAGVIKRLTPDWVVVLGDRIEAFAAASAASITGIGVCHIHGGDRAEGIADEAMRHAITKLAHLHCAATEVSAQRIVKMGEERTTVHAVGSPAIDSLHRVAPMGDAEADKLGNPQTVILHHPCGLPEIRERAMVHALMYGVDAMTLGNVLCLAPNRDPGNEVITEALRARCDRTSREINYSFRASLPAFRVSKRPSSKPACGIDRTWIWRDHLPRDRFIALLKRLAPTHDDVGGLLIGNSSAGLIEAQALGVRVVNVGPRQNGRERTAMVVDVPETELAKIGTKVERALSLDLPSPSHRHPYGDGRASQRIAVLLATTDPHSQTMLRKRIAY